MKRGGAPTCHFTIFTETWFRSSNNTTSPYHLTVLPCVILSPLPQDYCSLLCQHSSESDDIMMNIPLPTSAWRVQARSTISETKKLEGRRIERRIEAMFIVVHEGRAVQTSMGEWWNSSTSPPWPGKLHRNTYNSYPELISRSYRCLGIGKLIKEWWPSSSWDSDTALIIGPTLYSHTLTSNIENHHLERGGEEENKALLGRTRLFEAKPDSAVQEPWKSTNV